ncbi:hypothetical protein ACWGN5_19490 [Streptomyces sp. NPDC055815]
MGRRITRAGLAAGAALLLAACGGGNDPATGAATGGGGGGETGQDGNGSAAKTASLAQPGSLTVAFCQTVEDGTGGKSHQVILRSFAAKDGAFVGERATAMPAGTKPITGCEDGGPYRVNTAFNKDLTLVAGLVDGDRAAAFDLATGREVAPPDPDSFTKRPDNGGAAFHPVTDRLWYDMGRIDSDATGAIASRDPKGGLKTEENTPFEKVPDLLKKDGPTAETVLATDDVHGVAVPAGGIVATSGTTFGVHLSKIGPHSGGIGAEGYLAEIKIEGLDEDNREFCEPAFWRNATTLVCDFKQLTFSADYTKLLKTEDLVPENDRVNGQPVLSPDGKSFAFLSRGEDGRQGLFRGDFNGGAPVKITNVDPPVPDEDNLRTTLIRWN